MYVKVRLLNGWNERLLYKVPGHWHTDNLIGSLISVPLQKRIEHALVEELVSRLPADIPYSIKEALEHGALAHDPFYARFINIVSDYYALEPRVLFRRVSSFLKEKASEEVVPRMDDIVVDNAQARVLTPEQQSVVDNIVPSIQESAFKPFVVHGVTGSGKTEVYHHLILQALEQKKTVLLLLPEVSLAVRFTQLFRERLEAYVPVFGFHSATSVKEKRELWNNLKSGNPILIIGVHLPIVLPMPNLGLIIIDEEHDTGYQEKRHPKINTKEAALIRAKLSNIPIVLGSATPSISTLYNVEHRGWKLLSIYKRFSGAFPQVKVIKLDSKLKRPHFFISTELHEAINDRLVKKEQTLIFLNRRGYSFFIQCGDCGFIFTCSTCSVSLTYHEGETLCCHYCGFMQKVPESCGACNKKKLIKKGIGTQQVVTILQKLFPDARIARADMDTTVNKKKWQQTVNDFYDEKLDILVGTQTITKGYHFPKVTLVGVLWADMHLNLPTYNAAEITLQQLIQVAGRAGRQHPDSLVIVQTMLEHAIFKYLTEVHYPDYYAYEIAARKLVNYPPVIRFAEVEIRHEDEGVVESESLKSIETMEAAAEKKALRVIFLGPAQPPVHKIKNVHIRKIYLKGESAQVLSMLFKSLQSLKLKSMLYFTPNPLSM